jgi:hypothetical protein
MKITIKDEPTNGSTTRGIWWATAGEKVLALEPYHDPKSKIESLLEVIEKAKNAIQLQIETNL